MSGPAPAAASETGLGNAVAQEQLTAVAAEPASALLEDDSDAIRGSVKERVRETISNAPDPYGAWNNAFTWESKFDLVIDPSAKTVTIVSKLFTEASEATRARWEAAIEAKWGGKYVLSVAGKDGAAATDYRILCDLQWASKAKDAHYTVKENTPSGSTGGRAGLGGTSSMTDWGTNDTVDITHEFGHMLGEPEDYFTTNGIDHTHGGERRGFRDDDGGIMNNPSDDPFTAHYDLVKKHAARLLKVDEASCSVH